MALSPDRETWRQAIDRSYSRREHELRVIDTRGVPFLAAESEVMMGESSPDLTAVDLDGDKRPEVVVTAASGNAGRRFGWLYRWTGHSLVALNPTDSIIDEASGQPIRQPLAEPNIADIDGDGRPEVLEPSEYFGTHEEIPDEPPAEAPTDLPDQSFDLYSYVDGILVRTDRRIAYFGVFERGKGSPIAVTNLFAAAPGAYTLRVATRASSSKTTASAVIRLNGELVIGPPDFNETVLVVTRSISLGATNNLTVEVRSVPGSEIAVTLEGQ